MGSTQASRVAASGTRHPTHVPGQLIIRVKPAAVRHLAATSLQAATARAVRAAMPEEVQGPIDFLRDTVGLKAMKPLFVVEGGGVPPPPEGASLATVHRSLAQSATQTPRDALAGFQIVHLRDKKVTPALLKRLRTSKAVDLVEPVPNRWLCAVDPMINRQWGLRAIRWFNGNHPDAEEVHVSVIDSGIDAGHPDLVDSIQDYRHDGNSGRDFLGHGTHVSGTIAAIVNNAVGIAGVANCRLHSWKIFKDPRKKGSSAERFNFELYSKALAAALDSDIKVINLSIAGYDRSKAEAAVFAELIEAGVVVSTAMGNEFEDGNKKEYPAGYPGTIGVGAIDEANRRASFSNTGKHIALVAPGVNILSTVPRQKASFADHTDYDSWPGTSMATPHVTGAAALLYAGKAKSKASGLAVAKRLIATARKLPGMRGKKFTSQYGAGLLDVAAALGV
ncbi:hypothetical protein C2U70_28150 [Bradyrhizobium guangdongense]|uniref:S8 family peptidase n=1 Tax=Bradyrhizobium guangdongense TaxID=1325090 RepID=UPI00112921C3|nr:S8 family serine peptidase [Bradyrhizobium guangdongense]TPQ29730.1 hypothetical protein C2U70_28150 [Bradyrhizobium guangdongense]